VGGRILIIDDDPVNVKILGDFLSRKGCEVERATDGEEALTQLAHRRPDLILLDVLLPKINGLDLCRRIKQGQSAPPVFLMSAVYRSPSIQRDAQAEYGADAYFVKPFRIQDLWQHIEDKLGGAPARTQAAPLEGDLSKIGFARLLVTLHASEESGVLKIRSGHMEKLIYLDRGQPVAVESNLRSEQQQDTRERLLGCFMMTSGGFEFTPEARPPASMERAQISVPELVLEGVRRHVPQVELSREIELVRQRVVHAQPAAAQLLGSRLDDDAARVLRAIDGHATVEQVIARSGAAATAAMQILLGFILLGVAAVEETSRAAGEP
jgi:DNA-binding response OmpR family regulator